MTPAIRYREIRRSIPACLEEVDCLVTDIREMMRAGGAYTGLFAAELVLREALNNSVAHGCGLDPTRQVECVFRLRPGRIVLAVIDGGAGFDWRKPGKQPSPAILPETGRGMEILRRYASRIRFNQKGNQVVMTVRTRQGASI